MNIKNTDKVQKQSVGQQKRSFVSFLLILLFMVLLTGCKVDMLAGLQEEQANEMLSLLLRHGIDVEKVSAGKAGYTLSVESDQMIRALEILQENSLPRESFKSLGDVFSGQSMISSATEEQARMAFALSQELADTYSRIDGVLTARVHVVLGVQDQITNTSIPPSASVFLRHTPESPVVNLVPKVREVAANAVPGLNYDSVTVMLVPVRENVTVPAPVVTSIKLFTSDGLNTDLVLVGVGIAVLILAVGGACYVVLLRIRKKKEQANTASSEE